MHYQTMRFSSENDEQLSSMASGRRPAASMWWVLWPLIQLSYRTERYKIAKDMKKIECRYSISFRLLTG